MPRSTPSVSEPFPVRRVADVPERPPGTRWTVEGLWARAGVGIIGGLPKCKKTWLAAEIALGVATGVPVLSRFAVHDPGPVVFFGAEDDAPSLRERFAGLAAVRGVSLADAPVLLLDAAELRLDRVDHLARLDATVAEHRPRLLVLDPFVRLARVDENSAGDVSAVLGSLRALQRARDVAILVVHHMRKARTAHPGQQLRGSGDFAAWTDSALFLTRRGADAMLLTIEHRGAAAPDPVSLRLATDPAPHLALDASGGDAAPASSQDPLEGAVLAALADTGPQHTTALQRRLRVRKESVVHAVAALRERGLVARREEGWALVGA
ncbi:MAG: AAA family ATPase [Myxococcota bacterium]